MSVENQISTSETINQLTILSEADLNSPEKRKELSDYVVWLIEKNWYTNRGLCSQVVDICRWISLKSERDFQLTQKIFSDGLLNEINNHKENVSDNWMKVTTKSESGIVVLKDNSSTNEITNGKNSISEQSERDRVIERLKLADFAYVDLDFNKENNRFEIAENERMDKYTFTAINNAIITLKNENSLNVITNAINNPYNHPRLTEEERRLYDFAREYFPPKRVIWLETTSQEIVNDASLISPDWKYDIALVNEVFTYLKDELIDISGKVLNAWKNVVYWTAWTLDLAWRKSKSFIKWLFVDKKKEDIKTMDTLSKTWLKVVDQYRDEKTWFSATLMRDERKWWKLMLAVRGSDDLSDYLYSNYRISDFRLTRFTEAWQWMPKQIISLIEFMEWNDDIKDAIKNKQTIDVVWHSLGGTVSQSIPLLYPWLAGETATFNAPWIKQLDSKINPKDRKELLESWKKDIFAKIEKRIGIFKDNMNKVEEHILYFPNVMNYRNDDWIWNFWDKGRPDGNWHIWYISPNLPWISHLIEWLETPMVNMSERQFNEFKNWSRMDLHDGNKLNNWN